MYNGFGGGWSWDGSIFWHQKAETERLRCRLRIRNYISDTKILNPKYRYLFAYALILIVLYLEMFLHSSGYMLWWRLKLRWKWGVGWGSGKSTFPDTIIPMPIFLPKKLRPRGWGEGCRSGIIFLTLPGIYILQKCRDRGGGNNICTLGQIWGRILVLWLFSQNFTYFSRFWLQSDLKMQ